MDTQPTDNPTANMTLAQRRAVHLATAHITVDAAVRRALDSSAAELLVSTGVQEKDLEMYLTVQAYLSLIEGTTGGQFLAGMGLSPDAPVADLPTAETGGVNGQTGS
jgi:hypothetical protein